ncbi:MAG: M23 family metallopeptidase [Actinomycetaceae bacterium]|nr:M23 family metallopeptidase [Actinomycetaceae bacterium]
MTEQRPMPLSRREMRQRERSSRRNILAFKTGGRQHKLSRFALLAALGSLTIVAPLSGFVGPNMSISVPGRTLAGVNAEVSFLDLMAQSEGIGASDAQALAAVPAAASRARVREAIELGECIAGGGANGDTAAATIDAPLMWPMVKGTYSYSSPFGTRVHPITGSRAMHEGVDWTAPSYTNIYAVADGVVESAGSYGGGNAIYIKHEIDGEVFYSGYVHLYYNGMYVHEGQHVKVGQLVAGVGNTGRSTGPHLHFEIRDADKEPVDPMVWMARHGAVEPGANC